MKITKFWTLFLVLITGIYFSSCTAANSTKKNTKKAAAQGGGLISFTLGEALVDYSTVEGYLVGYLKKHQAFIGKDNVFFITGVADGEYQLLVKANNPDGQPVGLTQNISLAGRLDIGQILLGPVGSISGTVVLPSEAAVSTTVSVQLVGTDLSAVVAQDGTFKIENVPSGQYDVVFIASGFDDQTVSGIIVNAAGDTPMASVTIGDTSTTDGGGTTDGTTDDGTDPGPSTLTKLVGGEIRLDGGAAQSGSRTVSVSFVAPETATQVKFSENSDLLGAQYQDLGTFNYTFDSDGIKRMYVRFINPDNIQSDILDTTIQIDSRVPEGIVVTFLDGTLSTNLANPTISATANNTAFMRYSLTQAGLANVLYVPFSSNYTSLDISGGGEGPKEIWFQFKTLYGNESAPGKIDVNYVTTGPVITSYAFVGDITVTNQNDVDVNLTPDAGNALPVVEVEYSCDDNDYVNLEYTANPVTLDINNALAACDNVAPFDVSKTVYVRGLDYLGNTGVTVSNTIQHDTTPPAQVVVTSPVVNFASTTTPVNIIGTAEADATVRIMETASGEVTQVATGGAYNISVDLNDNAITTLVLTAQDAAGNNSSALVHPVYHDDTPPVISGIKQRLAAQNAVVQFDTDELTDASVVVGTGTGLSDIGTFNSSVAVLNHAINVTGLSQNSVYFATITATDAAGNPTSSSEFSFRTYIDGTGLIFANTTWNQTTTAYYVPQNFRVSDNATLTINPGVTVALENAAVMRVEGTIIAQGTSANPVVFTTNNPTPVAGDWDTILLTPKFTDHGCRLMTGAGSNLFEYVEIEYGTNALSFSGCGADLRNVIIRNSSENGLKLSNSSSVLMENSVVSDSGLSAIDSFGSFAIIRSSALKNSAVTAMNINEGTIFLRGSALLDNVKGAFVELGGRLIVNGTYVNNTPKTFERPAAIDSKVIIDRSVLTNATSNGDTLFLHTDADLTPAPSPQNPSFVLMRSIIDNYESTDNGSSLMSFMDLSDVTPLGAIIRQNDFTNNTAPNFILTNGADSINTIDDVLAEANFWPLTTKVDIQDNLIYDYVDEADLKAVRFEPFASAGNNGIPPVPPANLVLSSAATGELTFTFDPNTEADIAGYYLYYSVRANDIMSGTGAAQGSSRIDVPLSALPGFCALGAQMVCTLTGLTPGDYFATVSAYDDASMDWIMNLQSNAVQHGIVDTVNNSFATADITLPTSNLVFASGLEFTGAERTGFFDGQKVEVETYGAGSTLPTPLATSTDYYVIQDELGEIGLSTTQGGARVNITDNGSGYMRIFTTGTRTENLTIPVFTVSASTIVTDLDMLVDPSRFIASMVRGQLTSTGAMPGGLATLTDYHIVRERPVTHTIATIDDGTDTIEITAHGYEENYPLYIGPPFVSFAGVYYVQLDGTEPENKFQLTLTPAGGPEDLVEGGGLDGDTYEFIPAGFRLADGLNGNIVDLTSTVAETLTFTPSVPDRAELMERGSESWPAPEQPVTVVP